MGLGLKSFEDTFIFVKNNPKVLLLALIPSLFLHLGLALQQPLILEATIMLMLQPTLISKFLFMFIIYLLAFGILSLLVAGAYCFAVYQSLKTKKIDLKETLLSSLRRLVDIILVYILLTIIGLAMVSIPAFLLVIGAIEMSFNIIISIILFIFTFLVGIYISVRLYLFLPILLIENKRPIESLKESWRRTKNRFWSIFIAIVLLGLISIIITLPLSIPDLIFTGFGFINPISLLFTIISTTIVTTLVDSLSPILYFNLKKESSLK